MKDFKVVYELEGWTVIYNGMAGLDPLDQRNSIGVKKEKKGEWYGTWVGVDHILWPQLTPFDKRMITRLLIENVTLLHDGVTPKELKIIAVVEYEWGHSIGRTWKAADDV